MSTIVFAISGASAQVLAERSIQLLLQNEQKVHLIVSKGSYHVWQSEMGLNIPIDKTHQEEFWRKRLKTSNGTLVCHKWNEMAAAVASGSYKTDGMLIVPCSMGTVGRISNGVSLDLIERAADVHIKEKRKIVISPREMPLSLIHLRNLTTLAESGVTISPPMPAWYTKPKNISDMVDFIVARIFDSFGENLSIINRWEG